MQSSESRAAVERTLRRLGYPSRVDRKDLWTKPRAALGVPKPESDCIEVVCRGGFPRAVVAYGIQPEVVLAYGTGPAFSQPPPIALVFDSSGNAKGFKCDGNQFHATASAPLWEQTLSEPPGRISPIQATKVIHEVAEGNRNWFQDIRSQKVVGVSLFRILPQHTVALRCAKSLELPQTVIEWAKSQAPHTLSWACWYDLIPDWQELEGRLGSPAASGEGNESGINLRSAFVAELSKRKLIPAVDNQGSLVFVGWIVSAGYRRRQAEGG